MITAYQGVYSAIPACSPRQIDHEPPRVTEWEYKVLVTTDYPLTELTKAGKEGWELVAVVPILTSLKSNSDAIPERRVEFYLKRVKPG